MANFGAQKTYLGTWANSTSVVSFYATIPLGSSKLNGIVLGGWSYSGWNNTTLNKVSIAILDQNPNGTLKLSTEKYISDPVTNGEGSVIAADFNKDGVADIFLAAHNESPLVPTSSTAYLSQPDGTYKKVTLQDSIEAHSAILGSFNGIPTITTTGYGPTDPYYQFNFSTQNFDVKYWGNTFSGSLYGSSSVIGDFLGDGKSELVIGDFKTGPGYDFNPNAPRKLAIYTLNGGALANAPSFTATLYFDQPQYSNKGLISEWPTLSHNYRTWADDFNHDGKLDILMGVGVWSSTTGWQKNKLQMLQNQGTLSFTDVTDTKGQAYDENSSYVDYSMQIIDIDNSGITSYLMAGAPSSDKSVTQSNYLMVNDGTGKLYAALHSEFDLWTSYDSNKLIPYQLSNGSINYVLQSVNGSLYNLPLQYQVTSDFKQAITINDRNSSKLMRTWAGNDTFTDVNANSAPAHIDGGLGIDTSTYSQASSSYQRNHNLDGTESIVGNGISDTLVNIERLKFIDKSVAIDISGNAGTTAKILGAVFGKTAVTNRAYVGIGLDLLDKGMGYDTLAGLALNAVKATTNDQIVTTLWTNVVGSTPSTSDKAPFIKMLEDGMTPGALAHIAADTSYNTANINLVGLAQTGIEYTPVA